MGKAFEEIKAGLAEVLEYHRGNKTNARETTYIVKDGRAFKQKEIKFLSRIPTDKR